MALDDREGTLGKPTRQWATAEHDSAVHLLTTDLQWKRFDVSASAARCQSSADRRCSSTLKVEEQVPRLPVELPTPNQGRRDGRRTFRSAAGLGVPAVGAAHVKSPAADQRVVPGDAVHRVEG